MSNGNVPMNFSIYGLFFVIGIAISAIVAIIICKKRQIERYEIVYSGVFTMVGAMIGSKLFFLIVSIKLIIEVKPSILDLIRSGFVFYGGLVGAIAGLFIYVKKYKLAAGDFFDIFATVTPLGHAIGRIGCFLGGCCYGIPHEGFPSHTYQSAVGSAPIGISLLPIQLIEAICLLLLFVVELCIFIRNKSKKGTESFIYIIAYSTIRFTTEFFRGDIERGVFGLFSTSQWVSLILFFCAIGYKIFLHRKKRS